MPGAGAGPSDGVEIRGTGTLPFVGRADEISRFLKILEDPAGQAIVVGGLATAFTHNRTGIFMAKRRSRHEGGICGLMSACYIAHLPPGGG